MPGSVIAIANIVSPETKSGKPAPLLLLVGQRLAGTAGTARRERSEPPNDTAARGSLLGDDRLELVGVHARAAVLLGHLDAEDAQLAELVVEITGAWPASNHSSKTGTTSDSMKSRIMVPERLVVLVVNRTAHGVPPQWASASGGLWLSACSVLVKSYPGVTVAVQGDAEHARPSCPRSALRRRRRGGRGGRRCCPGGAVRRPRPPGSGGEGWFRALTSYSEPIRLRIAEEGDGLRRIRPEADQPPSWRRVAAPSAAYTPMAVGRGQAHSEMRSRRGGEPPRRNNSL